MRNHYEYVGVIAPAAGVLAGGLIYLGGWEHPPGEGTTPGAQSELLMMMAQANQEQWGHRLHSAPVLRLTTSFPTLGD